MEDTFIACFSKINRETDDVNVVCNNKLKTKKEAEKWFIKECKKCDFSSQLNDINSMFKKDVKYLFKPSKFMRAFLYRDSIKDKTLKLKNIDEYFDDDISFSQAISQIYI